MSQLTYNLQVDSKFRDIEKYPNPCDFGVTFQLNNTGTSVLGQPINTTQLFSPISIDPDYLDSNLQIQNAEVFTYVENETNIYLSGVINVQSITDNFSILYQPQPILEFPSTIVSQTGYTIVSLTGFNIQENPFIAVIDKTNSEYSLKWINYLTIYTGSSSSQENKSSRSTLRISPNNSDNIFWLFDFSSSITVVQYINNSIQKLANISEPANGSVCLLVTGYNISDGSTYKYEAREWGYELLYSDYSLEQTKDNGRFNLDVDEVNNIYVSGNTTTFKPTYSFFQYPFSTNEQNNTAAASLTDTLLYYMTGSDGNVNYTSFIPWNMENTIGVSSTGTSFVTFNKVSTNNVEYLGRYFIQKDPGAIYQQIGYKRLQMLRVNNKAYMIHAMADSSRSLTSYQSRIYELNPTGATGTLVSLFGSGPSVTYYPGGICATSINTDIYTFQRCGNFTGTYGSPGSFRADNLLIHKFDTLTNIGQTVCFTGPILGSNTGSESISKPLSRGGLAPGITDCMIAIPNGTDIWCIMFDANTRAGTQLVMPIILIKWNTISNTLTQYGNVLSQGPTWPQLRGIINYKSGKKVLHVSMNSNNTLSYFYDITNLPTITYITSINNNTSKLTPFSYIGDTLIACGSPNITNWDISDVNNMKPFGKIYQLGDDLLEFIFNVDYNNCIVGVGGNDANGWFFYKSQAIISNAVKLKQQYVTKNTGQYVRTNSEEFFNQFSYTPKYYNNTSISNYMNKMYLFSTNNKTLLIDDISNISYTIQRKIIDLTSFNFQLHPNRPNGIYATRYNTFIFDDVNGIYILFGFYNKLGLYFYNDNLNNITELYSESINLGGIVYIHTYIYNNEKYALFVFVNNIIRIYKFIYNITGEITSLIYINQTSPALGSFNAIGGSILVYYTLLNKYYLHLLGYSSITTYGTPRRLISLDITNPYSPVPSPLSSAFTIPLNISATSNGMSYYEDQNYNIILYLCQQTTLKSYNISNPLIYDEVRSSPKQGLQTPGYLQTLQSFYNKINKTVYLILPYFLSNIYLPNPIYVYKAEDPSNPILNTADITLQDNSNQNPVLNITICQNGNKTYVSFLYANLYYSSGPTGAYPSTPFPSPGTTGAIGPDVYSNYLYYIYDFSNPEFAGKNQNISTDIIEYPELPINGSSFITKFNADGSNGWLSYMGSKTTDTGLFTNISNFVLDYSKKYIYCVGGWQESIAFSQNSPSGVYNYFKSQNTVYNSFLSKLNIFTGEWIWSLPLIGNLDDFTERLKYQYYQGSELLLMSMFFNSFSLQTYQAINSSLNPSSIINNIINITNNTSSVSSVIYAFTANGTISWTIVLYSKLPLTNVYILDVDSSDGVITVVGITDTQELSCKDSTGKEVQLTYSNIDSTTQQYIFVYRFTYLGVYIASQRIEFPSSVGYLNINDIRSYPDLNKLIIPIVFSSLNQSAIKTFNKDGTFGQDITNYNPLIKNTIMVNYKHNSQYVDVNNKIYSGIKHYYTNGLNTGAGYYINYYNYLLGNDIDTVLNNSFSIRNSFYSNDSFYTILNEYIDTSKLVRNFINYENTGQFMRPDLNYYRCNLSKTITNGYLRYSNMTGGIININYENFHNESDDLYITLVTSTGIQNIPVVYEIVNDNPILSYNQSLYTIPTGSYPYLLINNKNESSYYTYQFYPGSLNSSTYFVIKKLTLTIPNRLIRNSNLRGTRDLNDLPYLYLKIFNENEDKTVDINNFNLVYDNNINTGTNACFQFPISYVGTTSNFVTLSLDIQPRIKFSFKYYNMRFQLIDPKGKIIQFDPTPYKASDSIFNGTTVSQDLLNITVRMQISISN
jgi:hypothetical protein